MKKLHLYMLKSFVGPFVATFFISMFVLIMQFLWRYIDDLVGKGLDGDVIIHLLSYVALTLVPMGLPLAVLLASIMTFGSLGENYELTALKAAGISLYRIMQPLIFLIILFTIAAFFFSNNVLPYANLKASTLLYDIKKQKPELSLKEGVFINDIEGYSIKVDKIDKKTGMMYDMLIYSHPKNTRRGNFETTIADSGIMEADKSGLFMEVQLYNGFTYTDEGGKSGNKDTYPFRRVKFDKQFFVIPLADNQLQRSDDDLFKDSYGMLNIVQLENAVEVIITDTDGNWLCAALEIWSYRCTEHTELIFIRWFYTDYRICSHHVWSDVKCCTGAIWWNVCSICFYYLLYCIYKTLFREYRHFQSAC